MKTAFFYLSFIGTLSIISFSITAQTISQLANTILLKDSAIQSGHIGISIYEPATSKYLYNYNATKYFIPASNTKIFSLYAGMKFLKDSLPGIKYTINNSGQYLLYPTGDPSFLHPDFSTHPVYNFLKTVHPTISIIYNKWKTNPLGTGWAWDDYNDDYMAERSMFPIYGNIVSFELNNGTVKNSLYNLFQLKYASDYNNDIRKSDSFSIKRLKDKNIFEIVPSDKSFEKISIPFIKDTSLLASLLHDTLQNISSIKFIEDKNYSVKELKTIYSQPSDSVFKPMMYRSDNFFAEQTLLMASNEFLGYMDEKKMIDTLLKTQLQNIPQKPQWVDGSGLSRYNLFTPQCFIYILNKLRQEFGMERLKNIFPTGGKGTLSKYYNQEAGYIFAKTGTLSNNAALSGYLFTKKGKLLIFSILTNNYQGKATPVRQAVERFLTLVRERY